MTSSNRSRAEAWLEHEGPTLEMWRALPSLTALLDAVAAEAEARGRSAAEMAVRFARFEEREACATLIEEAMPAHLELTEARPSLPHEAVRPFFGFPIHVDVSAILAECAARIRRRGEAEKKGGG